MSDAVSTPAYGVTRSRRASLSYSEFERCANSLLAAGDKPGLENIRKSMGGSPQTIRQMLKRYWAELARRVQSPEEALMRLPTEVADLAEELWQRALAVSTQSAAQGQNVARERLEQMRRDNEVRTHAVSVREQVLRDLEQEHRRTITELREQVATLLTIVKRNTTTSEALQAAKTRAEEQTQEYRDQLGKLLATAIERNGRVSKPKSAVRRPRPRNGPAKKPQLRIKLRRLPASKKPKSRRK
jgi:hypothetical protein